MTKTFQHSLMQHQLLENMTTAVLVFDDKLRVQFMNPAAEAVLAISGRQVYGLSIKELFKEKPSSTEEIRAALQSGNCYNKREARLKLVNGHSLTVDYAVTPLISDSETILLMELQSRDRLLRISREETLKAKQETARILVRGLAHEIKNPLGGLRGAAQLLARELPNEDLKDYTNVIIEEADRLRNLVDRMLGPLKLPTMAPINIHEVLERVSNLIHAETNGQLKITRDYDPSIPDVEADAEQLIQATLNIVRNAMQAISQHMPLSDGHISLRTRILRQFTIGDTRHKIICRVDIEDNGPGIPRDMLENIFYPMISGRADGSGLGLSISQSILTQHNGLIACESEPGKTVFSLFIPFQCKNKKDKNRGVTL
ncbi:nitrogen regulation protein NR(II) [Sansalvadorimonas sp. 2012CJ34-2]|uniref:Sensory histidine kinase/phosphatase NtrB n=1 Tax=Parendozoicomonas callyspongiae TaxID=2942213 RepID=A0ABT0PCX6_9GAMM|nr:nitrogen regulation protein NR(II) [Sansalvadorimonas sp. 2012CJ34-2]MCL6269220.1 nitrogen regulation protein NR(II) [Sansalvadorimonas sp. 2012CJ34-2]